MHSDVQDYATPPELTTLHGIDIPPAEAGGQTHFWDLFAAYEALSDELKAPGRHALAAPPAPTPP